jgi:hypothetical protein
LVGFGKKDLPEIMELIGTEKEIEAITAPLHAPPRWRRVSICTQDEIETFKKYTTWVSTKVNKDGKICLGE